MRYIWFCVTIFSSYNKLKTSTCQTHTYRTGLNLSRLIILERVLVLLYPVADLLGGKGRSVPGPTFEGAQKKNQN